VLSKLHKTFRIPKGPVKENAPQKTRYPPDSSEEREDDELMEEPREEVEEVVPVEHSLMLRS